MLLQGWKQKSLGAKSGLYERWSKISQQNFWTKLLCHVQSAVGTEENHTFIKKTHFLLIASHKHFSMMASTLPADGVTLTFFPG
jgi:hypothetical protein